MDLNLTQLGDQLQEKLKETSSLTRTLACKILERVRDFKENFSGWDTVSQWVPGTDSLVKKVYHRQPNKPGKAATTKKSPKKSSSKKPASKGRTKRSK